QAALCSARTGEGVPQAWQRIEQFFRELEPKGLIAKRRQQQTVDWLADSIRDELQCRFERHPAVQARFPALRQSLLRGEITAVAAARSLLAQLDAPKQN
ncbi:MAG TPA: hypothetical protein VN765_16245, partial [Candidatus Acidoferrum sp.]|nr:hypothetical protein [Candidatus Acidoferrum sp.]